MSIMQEKNKTDQVRTFKFSKTTVHFFKKLYRLAINTYSLLTAGKLYTLSRLIISVLSVTYYGRNDISTNAPYCM